MKPLPQTPFSSRFSLRGPLILAPMAGGPSTPELAAAVSNAGGLGFLGGAYLSPDQLAGQIERTRALTKAPFGVNLFVPSAAAMIAPDQYAEAIAATATYRRELGLPALDAPSGPHDDFERSFEVILSLRPAAFSFTFGLPERRYLDACRERGIVTIGGATTVEEARALESFGVDAVVAQGTEAGGHRFVFDPANDAHIGTFALVRLLARSLRIPVIAAGGIMDGAGIAAALTLGAQAAQLGTAFLGCPEAGTSAPYRRALAEQPARITAITRSFSGRPARGLVNRFLREMDDQPLLPFPLQNGITRDIRQEATRRGDPELLSLWAGQGVALLRSLPAGELVTLLFEELGKTAADAPVAHSP